MASEDVGLASLADEETVARCAIQPKYLDEGVFSENTLLAPTRIDPNKVKKARYGISVASKIILNTDDAVHAYGCRTAKHQNDNFETRKSRPPEHSEKSYYRGFYDLPVGKSREVKNSAYLLEIFNSPENGESAHCEIRMTPDINFTKDELSDARTEIIVSLALLLSGPERHLCEEDFCVSEKLDEVPLPDLPAIPKITTSDDPNADPCPASDAETVATAEVS